MYAGVDMNWAFDMSDPAGNSAWLLPNRIYEGGCFSVPVIGAADTETGRWIEEHRLGWTFTEPLEESLMEFFQSLDPAQWHEVKLRCTSRPREEFTGDADYAKLAETLYQLECGSSLT